MILRRLIGAGLFVGAFALVPMSLPLVAATDEVPAEVPAYTDDEVIAAYENDEVTIFAHHMSGALSAAVISIGNTSCESNGPAACYLITKNAADEYRVFELPSAGGYGYYSLGYFTRNIDDEYGIPVIREAAHSGRLNQVGSFANLATGELEVIGSLTMDEGKWQAATVGEAGESLTINAQLISFREFEMMTVQEWDITITAPDGSQRRHIQEVNTTIVEPIGIMYEQTVHRFADGLALEVLGQAILYDPVNGLRTE